MTQQEKNIFVSLLYFGAAAILLICVFFYERGMESEYCRRETESYKECQDINFESFHCEEILREHSKSECPLDGGENANSSH